jgi:hypothetical protein
MSAASPALPEPPVDSGATQLRAFGPPLVFFHIGKTGGTSLVSYLRRFARRSSVQENPTDEGGINAALNGTDFDFIAGHFPIAPLLDRLPIGWQTMTVIRNPLQHLPSCYWHIRTHATDSAAAELREMIDICKTNEIGALLQNRCGPIFESLFDNPQTRAVLGQGSGPLNHQDLQRAIELVSRLSFVGTTERIDDLAAQVGTTLPWAADWRAHAVPHIMINLCNVAGVYEMPRETLRQIIARTELDAELYQHATKLQLAQPAPNAAREAEPGRHSCHALPVSDLIRSLPLTLDHVRLGAELCVSGNEVLLHPPPPGHGQAVVAIENVPLNGHSELAGRMVVAHPGAPAVRFGLELAQDATKLADASFLIGAGRPADFRLRIHQAIGLSRLTLRTQVEGHNSNDFAWATFVDLMIR